MSEDLKTLRQIKDCILVIGIPGGTYIGKSELRAEAVRWVKEMRSQYDYLTSQVEKAFDTKKEKLDKLAVVEWIMHFFNIKEEELK